MCVGFRLDARAEAERVRVRLNSLSDGAAHEARPFWSNRDKGFVLAILQDRVGQAGTAVEACRSTLEAVHRALFPLDETPQGLSALLRKFRLGEAIDDFIRAQLVAGAMTALAFVRVRHPTLDLVTVGRGIPPTADGGPMLMGPYYAVARGPAENIIRLVELETRAQLQRQGAQ